MKIKSAEFESSAPDVRACPADEGPEIAFIGRSNVGKSSLINMLVERRELAKVSSTPGKTRLINFFRINDAWRLVDLPGYGYAKVSKKEREGFSDAVAEFLEERRNLRLVFVLIDVRLDPQQIDLEFLQWLAARTSRFALIFTKADKLKPKELARNIAVFQEALGTIWSEPVAWAASSSKSKTGRSEILHLIRQALEGQ